MPGPIACRNLAPYTRCQLTAESEPTQRRTWKEPQQGLPSPPLGSSFQAEVLTLQPYQQLVSYLLNPDLHPLTWLSGSIWDLLHHHRLAGQLLNWNWSQSVSLGLTMTLMLPTQLQAPCQCSNYPSLARTSPSAPKSPAPVDLPAVIAAPHSSTTKCFSF